MNCYPIIDFTVECKRIKESSKGGPISTSHMGGWGPWGIAPIGMGQGGIISTMV